MKIYLTSQLLHHNLYNSITFTFSKLVILSQSSILTLHHIKKQNYIIKKN